jgi:hypothetical protein
MTPWEIQGTELINCNCSYGCPCQFNALPTKGFCEAMGAISIDSGHHGNVQLDGVKIAVVFQWPGPIHEGKGRCQPVVDKHATPAQREAILKIMAGQDTEPFATMFSVFASTLEQVFDTVGEPIRNPVTGAEHRARIDLPHGFEYELAEVGSATSRSQGNIALDLKDSYGQFARLHLNNKGPIRHRTAA